MWSHYFFLCSTGECECPLRRFKRLFVSEFLLLLLEVELALELELELCLLRRVPIFLPTFLLPPLLSLLPTSVFLSHSSCFFLCSSTLSRFFCSISSNFSLCFIKSWAFFLFSSSSFDNSVPFSLLNLPFSAVFLLDFASSAAPSFWGFKSFSLP
jgi:hypothetical protein